MRYHYSVFLANVGTANDRYCAEYAKPFTFARLIERAASIPQLSGVDLVATPALVAVAPEIRRQLADAKLKTVSIALDIFTEPKWKQGSFSSRDRKVREAAMDHARQVVGLLRSFGSDLLTIWPGQDGFDYLFQSDYLAERAHFCECVTRLAEEFPKIRIALEYKPREPRTHSYVQNAGTALLTAHMTGRKNVGVALDLGHSLMAYENPADVVAMCKIHGDKLFHVHINDNFMFADDDLIAGSVRTLEYLEFYYWLNRTGYSGWITIDQFPYREDGRDACAESAEWLGYFETLVKTFGLARINQVIKTKNAIAASRMMRELLKTRIP